MDESNTATPTEAGFIATLARLQEIDWQNRSLDVKDTWLIELARAYRDNVKQWADYFQLETIQLFDNLAVRMDPSLTLPESTEAWLAELGSEMPFRRGRQIDGLRNCLCWALLKAEGKVDERELGLPEPYEPLMQFWEMGGDFWQASDGVIEFWPVSVGFSLTITVRIKKEKRKRSGNASRKT